MSNMNMNTKIHHWSNFKVSKNSTRKFTVLFTTNWR